MHTQKEIAYNDVIKRIEDAAKEYRGIYNRELCESLDIEEYGYNEFIGGKAEGFEESLEILRKHKIL